MRLSGRVQGKAAPYGPDGLILGFALTGCPLLNSRGGDPAGAAVQ